MKLRFFYIEKTGDLTIKAAVETKGNFTCDAAFLMVREAKTRWIKLADKCERKLDFISLTDEIVKNFRDGS